jgi:hypothetical protein
VIISSSATGYSAQLIDLKGKVCLTSNYLNGKQELIVETLPAGVYFLRIIHAGQILNKKIAIN